MVFSSIDNSGLDTAITKIDLSILDLTNVLSSNAIIDQGIRNQMMQTLQNLQTLKQYLITYPLNDTQDDTQQKFIDIINKELHNKEQEFNNIKLNNNEKLRMIQINQYYNEKYKAQISLMKLIIFFSIPLLIMTILYNKGILSRNITYSLGFLIFIVGIIMIIGRIIDINSRDNMNFSEYRHYVNIKDK